MIDSNLNRSQDNRREGVDIKKLYVKYMVCLRDKMILRSELDKMELQYSISVHGAVEFLEEITNAQFHQLKKRLSKSGLVLLDESESILIDRIIHTIVEIIHYTDTLPRLNFSDLVSEYAIKGNESILKVFSDVIGMSILQFIVIQKIDRAKEMLLYEDTSLSEMAELLNYRNKDFLIAQFRKVTGLTPIDFKRIKKDRRALARKYSKSSM